MTGSLISALIANNAFVSDTIVTAKYQSRDLFGRVFNKIGNFRVKRIFNASEDPVFELVTMQDDINVIKATADCIEAVDGMDVRRFADIYNLLPDGTSKKMGRKRGRKPKALEE